MTKHDLLDTLKRIRYDLTAAQAKLTDAMEAVAALPDDQPPLRCPDCHQTFRRRSMLEEHAYRHHNGPVPSSDQAAERAAGYTLTAKDRLTNTHGETVDVEAITAFAATLSVAASRARIPDPEGGTE